MGGLRVSPSQSPSGGGRQEWSSRSFWLFRGVVKSSSRGGEDWKRHARDPRICNGTRREAWKNINFCEICIILYRFLQFFFIWYDFYIRTFILVNERNRQKNNIYIYIFLHLIFDHVPLLPFKKPQICAIHQLRQVASLMGSNSPWQMWPGLKQPSWDERLPFLAPNNPWKFLRKNGHLKTRLLKPKKRPSNHVGLGDPWW